MATQVDPANRTEVFQPQNQINRTFYTNKHTYGSPNRGQQNILNFNEQGADDFLSRFGQAGGGAPNRDAQGNIIVSRQQAANNVPNRVSGQSQQLTDSQMKQHKKE